MLLVGGGRHNKVNGRSKLRRTGQRGSDLRRKHHRGEGKAKGKTRKSKTEKYVSPGTALPPELASLLSDIRRASNKDLLLSLLQANEDCTEGLFCLALASNCCLHVT